MVKSKPILVIALSIIFSISSGDLRGETGETAVSQWLQLGPLPIPNTAFEDEACAERWIGRDFIDLESIEPSAGDKLVWFPGVSAEWKIFAGEAIDFDSSKLQSPQITCLAAYVSVERRGTYTVRAETTYPGALYIDGTMEAKISVSASEEAPNLLLFEADWHRGKHLVILKFIRPGCDSSVPWTVKASVSPPTDYPEESVSVSITPIRAFTNYSDYSYFSGVSGLDISPDGKLAAMVVSQRDKESYKSHRWIEVRSVKDGKLVRQIKFDKNVSAPMFTPQSDALFYQTSVEEGRKLWRYDLKTGESETVLGPVKGLAKLRICRTGRFAVYTVDGKRELRGNDDYTLFTGLEERLTDWHDQRQIYVASLEYGAAHPLTGAGDFAVDDFALDTEKRQIAFTKRYVIPNRPYFITEIWLKNLKSGDEKLLLSAKIPFETRPRNLTFITGWEYLCFTASSHFTGGDEVDGRLMNLSEVDIYRLNLNTLELTNLTGHTQFTVDERGGTLSALFWNRSDRRLYFPVMVGTHNKLYSLDIRKPLDIRETPIPHFYMKRFDMSIDGKYWVFTASELDKPNRAFVYDAKRKKSRLLFDPNPDLKDRFEFAPSERWDFTDRLGQKIDGWILYPPGFDPAKKYPMIVYYYAGVWMLDESFYFTYHFWAANGYLVYALTPVGAMAHGDDFSAYHVNDWGEFATADIIEGVEKLTAENDFIDKERIGCYGGSYGGFTTMDLITKTDLFAAAVSMYGISNIASYWGGGIWGYTYGDIALTKSAPWNRKDIFVEKSPLFNADKITTPLLLLHGEKDVNVPELESQQMFTALKVLDKDVALVKFKSEGHGIAGSFKNYAAHREMMLEWFDKYLKDQPEGWERRWEK